MVFSKVNFAKSLVVNLAFSLMFSISSQLAAGQGGQDSPAADNERKRIVQLISAGQLSESESELEKALKADPDNVDLHSIRRVLGTSLLRVGKRAEGERQYEILVRYAIDNPLKSRALLKHIPQLILGISTVQKGIEPVASELLDGAVSLLKAANIESSANVAFSNGLSSMIGLKARLLARKQNWIEVVELYETELERLRKRWRSDNGNPENWLRLAYMLRSAIETIRDQGDYDVYSLASERVNLLNATVVRFPDSATLIKEAFNDRLRTIKDYEEAAPTTATVLYETLKSDILNAIANTEVKKPLYPLRILIEKDAQRFARQVAREKLIGSAIVLPDVEWLSEAATNHSELQSGLSVLYFFSPTNSELGELIKINDMLSNVHSDVAVALFIPPLDDSFSRIKIVNRPKHVTDEARERFRKSLTDDFIGVNNIQYPFGMLKDTLGVGNRLGVNVLPLACVYKDGICRQVIEGPKTLDVLSESLNELK